MKLRGHFYSESSFETVYLKILNPAMTFKPVHINKFTCAIEKRFRGGLLFREFRLYYRKKFPELNMSRFNFLSGTSQNSTHYAVEIFNQQ